MTALLPQEQFAAWYRAASQRQQDVLGDFAGRELCAILGESLLLKCLADARVDFQGGFQLLHAVHAVETFLSRLRDRGCNFHVLWFDDHESLLRPVDGVSGLDGEERKNAGATGSPDAQYARATVLQKRRLLRAVVIRHLARYDQDTSPDAPVSFLFASMESEAFAVYRQRRPVRLFFASDGQAALLCDGMAQDAAAAASSKMRYTSIIYRLSTAGHTVGVLDDVEFRSSEIRSTLVSAMVAYPFCPDLYPPPAVAETSLGPDAATLIDSCCETVAAQAADSPGKLTPREHVAVVAVAAVLKTSASADTVRRAAALLLHHAILRVCPLRDRPVEFEARSSVDDAAADAHFVNCYCEAAALVLRCESALAAYGLGSVWDVYDLMDGRLWTWVLTGVDVEALPTPVLTCYAGLAARVAAATGVDLPAYGATAADDAALRSRPTSVLSATTTLVTPLGTLLPFSHPDFDPLLEGVAAAAAVDANGDPRGLVVAANSKQPVKVVGETTHWHNTRKLTFLRGGAASTDTAARRRQLRRQQVHMADILDYASSLTSGVGKGLAAETIVTATAEKDGKTPRGRRGHGRGKGSVSGVSRPQAQTAAKAVAETVQSTQADKASETWRRAFARLTTLADPFALYTAAVDFYRRLLAVDRQVVGPDVLLLACATLGGLLAKNDEPEAIRPSITALLWQHLRDIQQLPLSKTLQAAVADIAQRLGLEAVAEAASAVEQPFLAKPAVAASLLAHIRSGRITLPDTPAAFQLAHCGPYMDRGFDSQPDARVSHFAPDAWQRRVLDAIDRRQSLFVVAPTSAGKTFISFYAMKQVLQESDDGVLVYVAPTKALCNQVAAEVQARFSKTYHGHGAGAARSMWAVKNRDTSVNSATGCQVLVTVPHVLQILLLSPAASAAWPQRLRWIVFDEVHSIGQSEDGVLWEQLLLMAPCPVIALSATVGNPGDFRAWLEGSERAKGRSLDMIVHTSRYSDLRCYIWAPPPARGTVPAGLPPPRRWPVPGLEADGSSTDSPFVFVHPVASLTDRSRNTLDDISLEARDCLALWRSMHHHQTAQYPLDPALDPAVFFGTAIAKSDVAGWEAALKTVLLAWLNHHDSPFAAVQADLDPGLGSADAVPRYGTERTLELLVDLQRRDALPALVFLYARGGCMTTLRQIVEQLEAAETAWKAGSHAWAKTTAEYAKHCKLQDKADKAAEKAAKRGDKRNRAAGGGGDDDDGRPASKLDALRAAGSQDHSSWAAFDPDAPLAQFSLANHSRLTRAELETYIDKLRHVHLDAFVIAGLRRGVAVHHAGMSRRYRQVVEILFRRGYLTAVVATGTLALGINMPCKTVVFSGDSTFLTALNFRQGAGRAGRRGFDILGNVVFFRLAPQRAKELMASRLPDLHGHFPVSTSLVLRTLTLLHHTARCGFAQACARVLFSQTRIYLGGPAGQHAVKHHVRFSVEYLRRHGLLAANGAPINFSGLVGHLYYTENAAFAFHALLNSGYFHRLCAGVHDDEPAVLSTLALVLAHIFERRPCRRYQDAAWLATTVRPSSSVILLPPLPADAEAVLHAHNASTLAVFRLYVQTFVQQHLAGQPDDVLPYSGRKVGPVGDTDLRDGPGDSPDDFDGRDVAGRPALPRHVELRSPFAALSGFDDNFQSIRELCTTVRAGVFLEEQSVPYLAVFPADTDGMPFNAYIYDFFRHGDLSAIIKDNGIKDDTAWYLLLNFSLVLASIVTSLHNYIDASPIDLDDFMVAVSDAGLDDYEGAAGTDEDDEAGMCTSQRKSGKASRQTAAGITLPRTPAKAKKPKIPDAWDDAGSDTATSSDSGADYYGKAVPSVKPNSPNSAASSKRGGDALTDAASPMLPPALDAMDSRGLQNVRFAFSRLKTLFDDKFYKAGA